MTTGDVRTIDAGGYHVRIGTGLRHTLAAALADVARAHTVAIVTDDRVGPLYADDVVTALGDDARVSRHVMPAGEEHKTRATWARVTDEMLAAGCGRDTTVIALGGGVVGDLAGFVAATYMRGVPVIQCPTSLLAMVDASVGAKTGVDTDAGKNLVGAFHPPALVLADIEVLRTLPAWHIRAGLAEAFKHGVLADESYFELIRSSVGVLVDGDQGLLLDVVARSVEIKAAVVREDAREHGRRKTLNFGHTIGHAIEHASRFSLLHGDCVAVGMVLEARIAEHLQLAVAGTAARIEAALYAAGLPTTLPAGLDASAVVEATRLDKKARAGAVEYALPVRVGEMTRGTGAWSVPVEDSLVRAVLG